MLKRTISLIFSLALALGLFAQTDDDKNGFSPTEYKFGKVHLVKAFPVITLQKIKGGLLAYETGMGFRKTSVQLVTRYFTGLDTTEQLNAVRAHARFELTPRYWYKRAFFGAFASPALVVNDKGEVSGGLFVGFQHTFNNNILIDVYGGLQTPTKTDNISDDSLFLRWVILVGYKFGKK